MQERNVKIVYSKMNAKSKAWKDGVNCEGGKG